MKIIRWLLCRVFHHHSWVKDFTGYKLETWRCYYCPETKIKVREIDL